MGPTLPGSSNVGVTVTTVADNAGIDSTKRSLAELEAESKTAGAGAAASFDNFNNSLKNIGTQMTTVGKSLSTYITLPIVGVAAESVKMAMNFQQSMELLVTNAGVAQGAIGGISQAILNMAGKVGQGPEALATAMYHIASAGNGIWTTAQQLDILATSAKGAAIGQADLDDTTYALTSALASNIKGAKDASEMMSTLVAIVGAGDMHMRDLNAAIGTGFLGTAATFGVSIQSIGTALATLGDNGEQGAAAATRLRMMLSLMASPSQAASKILTDLGLTTKETSTATGTMNEVFAKTGLTTTKLADDLRKPNGITVAIEDIKSRLEATGLSASQTDAVLSKAFGGGRTDAALLQLLQNTDRLNVKFTQINTNTGKFAQSWAEQQQTAKQQWDQAWGGIEADMIRLGVRIMPEVTKAMNDIGKGVNNVANWFHGLSEGQKQFVIDAAGVAAAMGPVLFVFGTLAKSLSDIGKLGSTVWGGLFGSGEKEGAISKISGMIGNIGGGAKKAGGSIGDMASTWASSISGMVSKWSKSVATMAADGAKGAGNIISDAASASKAWIISSANMVKSAAISTASMVVNAAKAAGAWIAAAHNSEIGLGGTLIKMAKDTAVAAALMVRDAAVTSAAWVKTSAISAAAAVKNAIIASAAWVKSAAVSSFAWVTQELPRIIASFASTSSSAVANAVIASAAWVKNAAISSAAAVAASVRVSAAWIATTVVAVAQGAIQGGIWVANAIKVSAYAVAIDVAKTNTYLLGAATVAQGALMAGVFAGLVIDVGLIGKAIQTVIQTYQVVKSMNAGMAADKKSENAAIQQMEGDTLSSNPAVRQRALNALHKLNVQGYASGSSGLPGGVALFGENGPELAVAPAGTQVYTAPQTSRMMSGSGGGGAGGRGVSIQQTNYNYSQFDLTTANRELAWKLANMV